MNVENKEVPITAGNKGNNKPGDISECVCVTCGAAKVLLQPACCLQAVLGIIESEVIARDCPRVSLRPAARDFTHPCSCRSQGLQEWGGEWIHGTHLGNVKSQVTPTLATPSAALAHPNLDPTELSVQVCADVPCSLGRNVVPTSNSTPSTFCQEKSIFYSDRFCSRERDQNLPDGSNVKIW